MLPYDGHSRHITTLLIYPHDKANRRDTEANHYTNENVFKLDNCPWQHGEFCNRQNQCLFNQCNLKLGPGTITNKRWQ